MKLMVSLCVVKFRFRNVLKTYLGTNYDFFFIRSLINNYDDFTLLCVINYYPASNQIQQSTKTSLAYYDQKTR